MTVYDLVILLFASFYSVHWLIIVLGMLIRKARHMELPKTQSPPGLSVVIPAFNEKPRIPLIERNIHAARSIGAMVIIVDDGSWDGGSALLKALARPGVTVIRHESNLGKAAALTTAFSAATTPIILTLDADTWIHECCILAGANRFYDPKLSALAIRIEAAAGNRIEKIQRVEYEHVLDFERQAFASWNQVFTVPGAASFWRRQILLDFGGFPGRTLAEDTDATLRLRLAGQTINVDNTLWAITLGPDNVAELIHQRARWIWGTIQASAANLKDWISNGMSARGMNIFLFFMLTVMHLLGYLSATMIIVRLAMNGPRAEELWLMLFLIGLTLMRLILSKRLYGGNMGYGGLLIHLLGIQLINIAAFWYGLASGKVLQKVWQR